MGNEQHKYVWQGSTLVSEYYGGKTLEFFYDESGAPYGFSYKSSSTAAPAMYYYVTNLQGDVTNVLDASGNTVASYTYNAWGKVLSSSGSMASINPIRYRGYYFDSDTGLYYLKSRYYDPQLARFINADDYVSSGQSFSGCNTFAYCGNNPVSRVDAAGHVWETVFDIVSLTFSIADVVANPANPWAWAGLAGDVADVMIPFVGGIGETIKAVGVARKLSKADAIVDVATSTIKVERHVGSYNFLRKLYKGTGMEVHHIIEKRFFHLFPEFGSKGAMASVALTKAEHAYFTRQWRNMLKYGSKYEKDEVIRAAYEIYANFPELLNAVLKEINCLS